MANTAFTISGLIESQLPDFINAKYAENAPSFRRFIELYYKWLENSEEGNTVYHIMNAEKYRDIDETQDEFISYFKDELLPYFPERTELEITKILKGAKEFYQKKGTEASITWLFRVLFNKESFVFYPKDNILRASDGKWRQPVSLKVSDSPFVVQRVKSSQNFYAARPTPPATNYHSSNSFSTSVEFTNNIKKNSTVIAFVSYKIWANVNTSPGTTGDFLQLSLTDYTNLVESSALLDGEGNKLDLLTNRLISVGLPDYDDYYYVNVLESYYTQNSSGSKILTFQNYLTSDSLKSIFKLGIDAEDIKIQYDGIQAYEFGNLGKDKLISVSEDTFIESDIAFVSDLSTDNANTPLYMFSFAKDLTGDVGVLQQSTYTDNGVIANTKFGDQNYILQYSKKFDTSNLNVLFTSTSSSANIAVLSFIFKEKTPIDLNQLERRLVIGETSGARAIVEKVFPRVNQYTKSRFFEIFLSNVDGEFINNELIYIDSIDVEGANTTFTERILGFVNAIIIDPNNRGLNYRIGDPVVIYNGFVTEDGQVPSAGFRYATAQVSDITDGRISSLSLTKGGYGFREHPNTLVTIVPDPTDTTISSGSNATIQVVALSETPNIELSLATDTILPYASIVLNSTFPFPANPSATISSTLISCLTYQNYKFYPIAALQIIDGGSGYSKTPTLSFETYYQVNGGANVSIKSLGMLANIEVASGGSGYSNGQYLAFNGLDGTANAQIEVYGDSISRVILNSRGYGYTSPPAVTVVGAGTGANLQSYLFSSGVEYELVVEEVGQIERIDITNPGFGYIAEPDVSLKVIDLYLENVISTFSSDQQLRVYQGTDIANATFNAYVDTGFIIQQSISSTNTTVRIYNYDGVLNTSSVIKFTEIGDTANILNFIVYGNGQALANLIFVDGTVTYPGYYLNTDGFLSADKKLQDKFKYHNYSYVIESDKQLRDYETTVKNIVHPSGIELIAHKRIVDSYKVRNKYSHSSVYTYEPGADLLLLETGDIFLLEDETGGIALE